MSAQTASHDEYREDKVRAGTTLKEVFVRLWPYFMRQKALFFGTIIAVFATVAAHRLSVTVIGLLIDDGIIQKNQQVVVTAIIAYFLLEAGATFMDYLHQMMFAKFGNRVLYELREDLVSHVQSLPISYFDKNPSGRVVTRLTNDVVSLGEMFTQGMITVFSSTVSFFAIVLSMGLVSWNLTLLTMAVAPPLLWVVVLLTRRILVALRDSKGKLAMINAYVAENIGGMRVLQLYNRVTRNTARFNQLSGDYREAQMRTVRLYAALWPVVSLFSATSVMAALYFGGSMAFDGIVTTGAMVAFVLHVRAFSDPLNTILEKYQVFQNSLSSAERIFTLQDEKPESRFSAVESASAGESQSPVSPAPLKLRGKIDFENVSFKYRPELANALEGIDLTIEPGQSVALVGRTGSGKSTTISLLQRLYDVTSGRILIDGKDIEQYDRRELRARIGVVQQDAFMFRGTVGLNISLGDPSIPHERIVRAADGARLGEFLASRPGGFDAQVEERGANLSFGERQLLAFARILAFDPDILILDEATANIDSHTEQLIQEATRKVRQGRTSLIIAHRISTIMDCDKIVVLDHGKIREVGTHPELYARGGIYRGLCDAQFNEHAPIDT